MRYHCLKPLSHHSWIKLHCQVKNTHLKIKYLQFNFIILAPAVLFNNSSFHVFALEPFSNPCKLKWHFIFKLITEKPWPHSSTVSFFFFFFSFFALLQWLSHFSNFIQFLQKCNFFQNDNKQNCLAYSSLKNNCLYDSNFFNSNFFLWKSYVFCSKNLLNFALVLKWWDVLNSRLSMCSTARASSTGFFHVGPTRFKASKSFLFTEGSL